ncbi:MAG: hypothetical protein ABEJ65_09020 [bacterium]
MNEVMVLDIGTGTIIGLIGRMEDGDVELLARAESRYPGRAVEEGKIVDVELAARTTSKVVNHLSEEAGTTPKTAHYSYVSGSVRGTPRSTWSGRFVVSK